MPFRGISKYLLPWWLTAEDGGKVAYSIELLIDATQQRLRDALMQRFPSKAGDAALALIGQDRGIPRGRTETNAHYAQRLIRWRWPRGHRVRGNAFALLEQVSEYFGGLYCAAVDVRGTYCDRTKDGVESFEYGHSWDWDGTTTPKRRFWLVIDPVFTAGLHDSVVRFDPPFKKWASFAAAFADPDSSLGQDGVSRHDVEAIRNLFRGSRAWKPAGTRNEWAVISFGSEAVPDSTWARWSKVDGGNHRVLARDPSMRYWFLRGVDLYAGDPTKFAIDYPEVGGGTYAGNSATFPATISLPSGGTYAGDPASFPNTIPIPDDGT